MNSLIEIYKITSPNGSILIGKSINAIEEFRMYVKGRGCLNTTFEIVEICREEDVAERIEPFIKEAAASLNNLSSKMESRAWSTKTKGASSKYLGVFFEKNKVCWNVFVSLNKKRVYVGKFKDEVEAAIAHDRFVVENIGLSAPTNFPKEQYVS